MTYGIGIGFPMKPTKKDIKELRRQVAHDRLEVIKGERSNSKVGPGATRPAGDHDRTAEKGGG